ncbi:unnamed protein product [Lampetra planeri]
MIMPFTCRSQSHRSLTPHSGQNGTRCTFPGNKGRVRGLDKTASATATIIVIVVVIVVGTGDLPRQGPWSRGIPLGTYARPHARGFELVAVGTSQQGGEAGSVPCRTLLLLPPSASLPAVGAVTAREWNYSDV